MVVLHRQYSRFDKVLTVRQQTVDSTAGSDILHTGWHWGKISPIIRWFYFFNAPSFCNTNFFCRDRVLIPKMSEKIISPFIIEAYLKIIL